MRINSIYPCIAGEGLNQGIPMVMVRMQGCPLKCSYCDTLYAQNPKGGKEFSTPPIVWSVGQSVKRNKMKWVCISGGEPLMQEKELGALVKLLFYDGMRIEIETSGFYLPPNWMGFVNTWCCDYKCPSSGMELQTGRMDHWLSKLCPGDMIKFVVSDDNDLDFVLSRKLETKAQILISPAIWGIKETSDGRITICKSQVDWNRTVAKFCQENGYLFSLQVHKTVWGQYRSDV